MEEAALQGIDGASGVSLAGSSDTAANIVELEQSRVAEVSAIYSRESILHFELVRGVSSAGSALRQHRHLVSCGDFMGNNLDVPDI